MITTLLNNAIGLNDLDGNHLMTRLQIDPIGVKDPNYTDTLLWTANKVVQVADPAAAAAAPATRRVSARLANTATAPAPAPAPVPTPNTGTAAPAAPANLVNDLQHVPTHFNTKLKFYQRELCIIDLD